MGSSEPAPRHDQPRGSSGPVDNKAGRALSIVIVIAIAFSVIRFVPMEPIVKIVLGVAALGVIKWVTRDLDD